MQKHEDPNTLRCKMCNRMSGEDSLNDDSFKRIGEFWFCNTCHSSGRIYSVRSTEILNDSVIIEHLNSDFDDSISTNDLRIVVTDLADLQCLEIRVGDQGPKWVSCIRWPIHVSGSREHSMRVSLSERILKWKGKLVVR